MDDSLPPGPKAEAAIRASAGRPSAIRFAAIFGSAVVVSQLAQLVWLAAGSRTMSARVFGTVLAAQALYAFLQTAVDSGTALHGARLAAAGELDGAAHGSVVRLRVQLALAGGVVALGVSTVAGTRSVVATAPYVAALVLFALMNYWTRFGLGDSRPWSSYILLRTAAPAVAASAFLVLDAAFPVFLAGVIECAVILAVALAFRLRPVRDARLAFRARDVPWRIAVAVGLPFSLAQISFVSGTVLLNASGASAAAGAFAVGVRLVTGVNALSVILVSALFPGLASRSGAVAEESEHDHRTVGIATDIVVVIAAASMALLLARTPLFVDLFLNRTREAAQATTILVLGGAAAAGFSLLLTMVLVARRLEAAILRAYALSTFVTLAGGAAVIVADPGRPAVAMAVPLLVGQLLTVGILERRTASLLPALRGVMRRGAAATVALAAVGVVGALSPATRPPLAVGSAAVAVLFVVLIVAQRRDAGRR